MFRVNNYQQLPVTSERKKNFRYREENMMENNKHLFAFVFIMKKYI